MEGRPPLEENRGSDGLALLRAVATQRRRASRDLGLREDERLSDRERIVGRRTVQVLVQEIEDRLRARLAGHFEDVAALHASLASARVPIAWPMLERAEHWWDDELVASCLIHAQDRSTAGDGGADTRALLTRLVTDPSEAISSLAMGLLVAASRQVDDDPSAEALPPELLHRLTWQVAAALRTYIVEEHGVLPTRADETIAREAAALLAADDEAGNLEALALRLARELHHAEKVEVERQAVAAADRRTGLFDALLAIRTRLRSDAVRDLLSERTGRGLLLLLKAAGIDRMTAASVLANSERSSEAERLLTAFDGLSAQDAHDSLAPWRADPLYRSALVGSAVRP